VVGVGVEEEVRRAQDPDAPATAADGGRDVEAGEESGGFGEGAVAVDVFVDGDLVGAAKGGLGGRIVGRGGFLAVVHGAPEAVVRDGGEAGGRGVLEVLHDPHAAALIEVEKHGLGHDGLLEDEIDGDIGRSVEGGDGRGGLRGEAGREGPREGKRSREKRTRKGGQHGEGVSGGCRARRTGARKK
jgi:hypothetical protein